MPTVHTVPTPTVVHRPTGPINLTRTTTNMLTPMLTVNQHDQHIQSINTRLFSSSMTMKSSLKLVDETLTWCDNGQLNNYLQDSDGFVVIGAIGREKVGKSTLLSLLGGNQFIDEDRLMIFPAASSSSRKITRGIDIYLTNEQTILLDTQPLLSAQLHQQQILQPSNEYHRSQASTAHLWQQQIDPRMMYIDNILELQTLEIIAFILAVCHVVLIVEDQFADPYLYRLLQLAEILRPVLKRNTHEILRTHSPHLVFVLNKCQNYISPQEQQLIKRTLAHMMMDTHFQIYSSLKPTKKIPIATNLKHIVHDLKQQELNENLLVKLLNETHITHDEHIEQVMNEQY
jgi:GTPase SAR1 family protein